MTHASTAQPDPGVALFYAGTERLSAGDLVGAEAALRQAIAQAPALAEAHANLGLTLEKMARWTEAENYYREALTLAPWNIQIHLNFGTFLAGRQRCAEAEALYRQALTLDPTAPALWSNLGIALAYAKREAEAEQCYRTAMEMDPDYAKAPFNLAYLLLRQGRYAEGWQHLESRDWYAGLASFLPFPRWQGEPLAGKSILIGCEAGHGDMLQFCRYAAQVKAAGAVRVSILCQPGLKRLFATLPGADEIIGLDEPLPNRPWDYWVPPLSLPFHFKTTVDTIPAALPYLAATPADSAHWAGVIGSSGDGLRVGLVWQGNPRFENDAERSLGSLDLLAPLGDIPEVRYFSLQKGVGEAEAAQPLAGLALTDLAPGISDFADTAAIVANLDLVITVDTAVAHLAGALGRPCWVLLPDFLTDWRWLAERSDSPWYPGALRLFRQAAGAGWPVVIAEVKAALQALAAQRSATPADAGHPTH